MTGKEPPKKKVFLATFGCQMNKLDSELLLGTLLEEGWTSCGSPEEADLVVLNTCSVRRHAEEKVYSRLGLLRKIKEKRPGMRIAVVGCMAQSEKARILERAPGVDVVAGTSQMWRLGELLRAAASRRVLAVEPGDRAAVRRNPSARPTPFQAYVAVSWGCDNRCSYCVVPSVRGAEVSRPMDDILDEVRGLADDGVKEVTLLGQNVDSYGKGLGGAATLASLLEKADRIEGIERLRFVTSHPRDVTPELLDAVAKLPKVCEYLHLPAQSGSDRILDLMRRGYGSRRYREILDAARRTVPDIAISSDFIVGFPTETEEDFEATRRLLLEGDFANSFIFKFSPRPGTPAAEMPDDVPRRVKEERNRMLLDEQERTGARRNASRIGSLVEVLVEGASKRDAENLAGRTRDNSIVVFPAEEGISPGELVEIGITDATALTLIGRRAPAQREGAPARPAAGA